MDTVLSRKEDPEGSVGDGQIGQKARFSGSWPQEGAARDSELSPEGLGGLCERKIFTRFLIDVCYFCGCLAAQIES